jgi:2'-hydroxyisoflavone reductase
VVSRAGGIEIRLLVLGGGGFLGYHVVAEALRMGHEVSTFSREGEAPLAGVEALEGDRQDDLRALRGRSWDAVVDTFSDPDAVGETARLLSGSVGAYGYVSGMSIYHPDGPPVVSEDAPLRRPGDAAENDPLQERSIAKIRCEETVGRYFSGPVVTTHVGIMVGPHDPTDSFSWWPSRLARALVEGGEVLAPGDPKRPVQFSDARDIAAWMVGMLDAGVPGTYNAVGPGRDAPISGVLDACRQAADDSEEAGPVELTWAAEGFLREQLRGMPEEERPLWFPEDQIPFQKVDSSRALAAGLTFRPAYETARDALAWVRDRPGGRELGAGFSDDTERGLLRRWHARPG